jgi:hypothetical protein
MKIAISILIIVAVVFAAYKTWEYWDTVNQEREVQKQAETDRTDGRSLPGLPYQAETGLQEAYQKGTPALKEWLDKAKRSGAVNDPRLAWIELDYAVRLSGENPIEAKRIFAEVKKRTSTGSPVYRRIKELEKTYE